MQDLLILLNLAILSILAAQPALAAPLTITNGTQFVDTSGYVVKKNGSEYGEARALLLHQRR
jgi:hypothetical protein